MQSTPRDPNHQIDLLQSLSGRGLPKAEPTPARQREVPQGACLEEFYPQAAAIRYKEQTCRMLVSQAQLAPEALTEGYRCPILQMPDEQSIRHGLRLLGGDPCWGELSLDSLAFIDTETTGLAGGSGTYVFLIGVGRFENGVFTVRQYFMEDYTQEEALIEAVSADLAGAQAVVSYNGKSFDLPLMQTRWRMNRRQPQFPQLHLDLLHIARRLWRSRLPNCRLGTVEQQILGIERHSDIDSALIPWVYFDFLKSVRPERMVPVIDHHAQDIFSLGALLLRMTDSVCAPEHELHAHSSDQVGLHRILQAAGHPEQALSCLERAHELEADDDHKFRLSLHLARMNLRAGCDSRALALWYDCARQAVDAGRIDRLAPLVELAKYHEHRNRDYGKALEWTQRAISIADGHGELSKWIGGTTRQGHLMKTLEHRRDRLNRRLNRAKSKRASR